MADVTFTCSQNDDNVRNQLIPASALYLKKRKKHYKHIYYNIDEYNIPYLYTVPRKTNRGRCLRRRCLVHGIHIQLWLNPWGFTDRTSVSNTCERCAWGSYSPPILPMQRPAVLIRLLKTTSTKCLSIEDSKRQRIWVTPTVSFQCLKKGSWWIKLIGSHSPTDLDTRWWGSYLNESVTILNSHVTASHGKLQGRGCL